MPKHLVTALGVVLSLGVVALGVFLVALPFYLQAINVIGQTATVAQTNESYRTQVDSLRAQEQNLDQINASVAALRSQITATSQLDDVFEVVGRAAAASGVTLTGVTAGDRVAYVTRTSATEAEPIAPAPVPAPEPTPTLETTPAAGASGDSVETPVTPSGSLDVGATGRQQVDFEIRASAVDMAQATAFLDALRSGPRLLSSVTASATQSGSGSVDIQISALTYVDSEG